jgi:hypothetical protein
LSSLMSAWSSSNLVSHSDCVDSSFRLRECRSCSRNYKTKNKWPSVIQSSSSLTSINV